MAFSDNLQFIRAQAGVTQEQLAEQLDVSRQSVSKWESGASFPEMDTLLRCWCRGPACPECPGRLPLGSMRACRPHRAS